MGQGCASPSPYPTSLWCWWLAAGPGLRSAKYFSNSTIPRYLCCHCILPLHRFAEPGDTKRGMTSVHAKSPARDPATLPSLPAVLTEALPNTCLPFTTASPSFHGITHASCLSTALANEFQLLLPPKTATKILLMSPVLGRLWRSLLPLKQQDMHCPTKAEPQGLENRV